MREQTADLLASLQRASAELKAARNDYASARWVLDEHPLRVIVPSMRRTTDRLLAGRDELERTEGRKRRGAVHATASLGPARKSAW